jgi:arylformamidase
VAGRRVVDLSHPIEDGMITYPGLPAPKIGTYLSREASAAHYAPGTSFHIGQIDMVANTGTYLDAPAHRFADGVDIADVPLEHTADLDAVVVATQQRRIDAAAFDTVDVAGRAVLLHTGWDRHWGTGRYGVDAPDLSRDGAELLRDQGAALVGIDSVNIDDTADPHRPAHTVLLRAGIPVLEHLRGLDQLPGTGFRLHAAPVPVRGLGTFPVRAYAVVGG